MRLIVVTNQLLRKEFPQLATGNSIDALFDAFDTDGNGTIDFQEFAIGLCKRMPGDPDSKLTLIIEALTHGKSRVPVAMLRDLLNTYAEQATVLGVVGVTDLCMCTWLFVDACEGACKSWLRSRNSRKKWWRGWMSMELGPFPSKEAQPQTFACLST